MKSYINKGFRWHFFKKLSRILGRKKVVFLHIQKTAGTSIVTIARERYGTDLISHGDYIRLKNTDIGKFSFVSGHFGFDYAQKYLRGRYSFTFLRDPIERILSFYYFCRTQDPNEFPQYAICQNLSLTEFFELAQHDNYIRQFVWNHMTSQLACGFDSPKKLTLSDFSGDDLIEMAINNLMQFSYVGFTETADMDINKICKAISLPIQEERALNLTDRPDKKLLSQYELGLAYKLTELDYKLYKSAWSKFKPKTPFPNIISENSC